MESIFGLLPYHSQFPSTIKNIQNGNGAHCVKSHLRMQLLLTSVKSKVILVYGYIIIKGVQDTKNSRKSLFCFKKYFETF